MMADPTMCVCHHESVHWLMLFCIATSKTQPLVMQEHCQVRPWYNPPDTHSHTHTSETMETIVVTSASSLMDGFHGIMTVIPQRWRCVLLPCDEKLHIHTHHPVHLTTLIGLVDIHNSRHITHIAFKLDSCGITSCKTYIFLNVFAFGFKTWTAEYKENS